MLFVDVSILHKNETNVNILFYILSLLFLIIFTENC